MPINHELSMTLPTEVPARHGLTSGNGRPHNAEWYVKIGNEEFAKGSISHPEHKTLILKDWHRVYCNKETVRQVKGLTWVD